MTATEIYKGQPLPLHFEYKKRRFIGLAQPIMNSGTEGFCTEWEIFIEDGIRGILKRENDQWIMENVERGFAARIGQELDTWQKKPAAKGVPPSSH